jgi:hypothetical protein
MKPRYKVYKVLTPVNKLVFMAKVIDPNGVNHTAEATWAGTTKIDLVVDKFNIHVLGTLNNPVQKIKGLLVHDTNRATDLRVLESINLKSQFAPDRLGWWQKGMDFESYYDKNALLSRFHSVATNCDGDRGSLTLDAVSTTESYKQGVSLDKVLNDYVFYDQSGSRLNDKWVLARDFVSDADIHDSNYDYGSNGELTAVTKIYSVYPHHQTGNKIDLDLHYSSTGALCAMYYILGSYYRIYCEENIGDIAGNDPGGIGKFQYLRCDNTRADFKFCSFDKKRICDVNDNQINELTYKIYADWQGCKHTILDYETKRLFDRQNHINSSHLYEMYGGAESFLVRVESEFEVLFESDKVCPVLEAAIVKEDQHIYLKMYSSCSEGEVMLYSNSTKIESHMFHLTKTVKEYKLLYTNSLGNDTVLVTVCWRTNCVNTTVKLSYIYTVPKNITFIPLYERIANFVSDHVISGTFWVPVLTFIIIGVIIILSISLVVTIFTYLIAPYIWPIKLAFNIIFNTLSMTIKMIFWPLKQLNKISKPIDKENNTNDNTLNQQRHNNLRKRIVHDGSDVFD